MTGAPRGRRRPRRIAPSATALVAALLAVGCGAGAPDEPSDRGSRAAPAPTDTVAEAAAPADTIDPARPAPLSEYHLRRFRERGVEEPLHDIPADLRARPELIPDEPVLGGTMRFTRVALLTDRWVLATYEDGHVQGHAIYEYTVEDDGGIRWAVVAHYID